MDFKTLQDAAFNNQNGKKAIKCYLHGRDVQLIDQCRRRR